MRFRGGRGNASRNVPFADPRAVFRSAPSKRTCAPSTTSSGCPNPPFFLSPRIRPPPLLPSSRTSLVVSRCLPRPPEAPRGLVSRLRVRHHAPHTRAPPRRCGLEGRLGKGKAPRVRTRDPRVCGMERSGTNPGSKGWIPGGRGSRSRPIPSQKGRGKVSMGFVKISIRRNPESRWMETGSAADGYRTLRPPESISRGRCRWKAMGRCGRPTRWT